MVPSKHVLLLLPILSACGDAPVAPVPTSAIGAERGGPEAMETDQFSAENVPAPALDESDLANLEGVLYGPYFDDAGTRSVWVRRVPRALWTELVVAEHDGTRWKPTVLITGSANPDRPAISADGQTIAFVAGLTGIASVWTMPFDGTDDPIQHTNADLHLVKRAPGQAPPGFVPPPSTGTLLFEGDHLSWEGPSGTHSVRWR